MAATEESSKKYNKYKTYKGAQYSGMKVGATHKWYYDQGEWRERKVTPDEWEVYYETPKRRAGKAPEGTGAPVGTEYNWLIVAHQRVDKIDANCYTTRLEGKKFKVAHKRSGKGKWSITEKSQRKKVIQYLEQVINELKEADETEEVPYTVKGDERLYGLRFKNMKELNEIAKGMAISGRSKMSKEELITAIQNQNGQQGEEEADTNKGEVTHDLKDKSFTDLYEIAKSKEIKDRSEMNKNELVKVLQSQD